MGLGTVQHQLRWRKLTELVVCMYHAYANPSFLILLSLSISLSSFLDTKFRYPQCFVKKFEFNPISSCDGVCSEPFHITASHLCTSPEGLTNTREV